MHDGLSMEHKRSSPLRAAELTGNFQREFQKRLRKRSYRISLEDGLELVFVDSDSKTEPSACKRAATYTI